MNSFWQLLRAHSSLLTFGFLLTFFSSFGQTFLLSLYVPELAAVLEITEGRMGSLYALATLGSASILMIVGRYIDWLDLRLFTFLVVIGGVLALLGLSFSSHFITVILSLLGLRLCGQGLMSHTAITTMARYFQAARGKAISVATLGFPSGEALLPVVVAFTMSAVGWRSTLQLSALALGPIMGFFTWWLLRRQDTQPPLKRKKRKERDGSERSSWYFLRSYNFWVIAPNVFFMGFINTAVFFFQVPLGASKGWSVEWVAASLAAFAASSAISMFTAGPLVDRFTARRLFPYYFFPYLGGLILLASFSHQWIYPASLFLMGLSNGLGSTIKNALQAELFGVKLLGTVRSLFTVLMVISTALGPFIFGTFLDGDFSFEILLWSCVLAIGITILQSFRISKTQTLSE